MTLFTWVRRRVARSPSTLLATCVHVQESLSAMSDGELGSVASVDVARHLEDCPNCRSINDMTEMVNARLRIRAAEFVPDLSDVIVDRLDLVPTSSIKRSQHRHTWGWAAAVIPAALSLSGLFSGAFTHPRITPTHQATTCTAHLVHTVQSLPVATRSVIIHGVAATQLS